jgi:hypothetical protein
LRRRLSRISSFCLPRGTTKGHPQNREHALRATRAHAWVAMTESRGGAKRTAVLREGWAAGDAETPVHDMYVIDHLFSFESE